MLAAKQCEGWNHRNSSLLEKDQPVFTSLRGRKNIAFNLYDKVGKDNRQSLSKIIYQEDIKERGFKDWSMAFKNIDEIDTSSFPTERTNIKASIAINLIQSFKSLLP